MKVILCNCPPDKAKEIAKQLVEKKVAACVNVIHNVTSFYHWQGNLCEEAESTLLIKLRKTKFKELEKELKSLHPYSVPEIVELNVSNVNMPYLKWIYEVTE